MKLDTALPRALLPTCHVGIAGIGQILLQYFKTRLMCLVLVAPNLYFTLRLLPVCELNFKSREYSIFCNQSYEVTIGVIWG